MNDREGAGLSFESGHGLHARTGGFTSFAVVIRALGGWRAGGRPADAAVGLAISAAIVRVLLTAARDIYRQLMDGVDPNLVSRVEELAGTVEGVEGVASVRTRWVGHDLHATIRLTVEPHLTVEAAHDTREAVNLQTAPRDPAPQRRRSSTAIPVPTMVMIPMQ